jgi:NTP pyrophosphatase (non-canonical NTP hydrolase)
MALQEEVGEFTSEIRKLTKMMFNQKKIDSFKIEDLENEASDVLITLILVLKSC